MISGVLTSSPVGCVSMPDTIVMRVASGSDWVELPHALEAVIESDLYVADDAYSVTLPESVQVQCGVRCQMFVNGQLEMTGTVDKVTRKYSRTEGPVQTIEGRDLMGILVDSYCEDFFDTENMSVKAIAERLLRKVPFINRKEIVYGSGAGRVDSGKASTHIDPGSKICETLQQIALSRGMLFYLRPDGTFVFGLPKGREDSRYSLVNTRGQNRSSIIEGEWTEDYSVRYSKVAVMTQTQEDGEKDADLVAVKTDVSFPFYKPMVEVVNEDAASPGKIAAMILERQRFEGRILRYKVHGFTQNARNWTIDELCMVDDDVLGFRGDLLIYGRTFTLSKKEGALTELRLGLPGVAR